MSIPANPSEGSALRPAEAKDRPVSDDNSRAGADRICEQGRQLAFSAECNRGALPLSGSTFNAGSITFDGAPLAATGAPFRVAGPGVPDGRVGGPAEPTADGKKLSAPVQAGDGYFQTIMKMHPDMDPSVAGKLAKEARQLNGGNTNLVQNSRFEMPAMPAEQPGERHPAGRESRVERRPQGQPQSAEDKAREQRATQTRSEFAAVEKGGDGLDAGRKPVPDIRKVMGLNDQDSGAVDKWMADPKNAGKTLADAVGPNGLRMRTTAQIEKDFTDHSGMVARHDEAYRQIKVDVSNTPADRRDAAMKMYRDSDNGVADQPARQQAATAAFAKAPWETVPRTQLTGLPDDKQKMLTDAKAAGDPRSIEQIGVSMGYFDQKRADELSATFKKLDFVQDRAVKEKWNDPAATGPSVSDRFQKTEEVYKAYEPLERAGARPMTRPESDLVGLHNGGQLTEADRQALHSRFRGLDRAMGSQAVDADRLGTPDKLEKFATDTVQARAKFTGERTGPAEVKAEMARIAKLNEGGPKDGKMTVYSNEELQGWRTQTATRSTGLIGEYMKYNSGGKINDAMIQKAENLRAAYQAVDKNSAGPIGKYLKAMGADTALVESSFAAQTKAREGVKEVATKYNLEHPSRAAAPDRKGDLWGEPDISRDTFVKFLQDKKSPWAKDPAMAGKMYDLMAERGLKPGLALGFARFENNWGRDSNANDGIKHAYGAERYSSARQHEIEKLGFKGGSFNGYQKYDNILLGTEFFVRRMEAYHDQAGLKDLQQVSNYYITGNRHSAGGYGASGIRGTRDEMLTRYEPGRPRR